jgi:hypothetical protein
MDVRAVRAWVAADASKYDMWQLSKKGFAKGRSRGPWRECSRRLIETSKAKITANAFH